MNPELLLEHFDRISDAPDAIARLRSFIRELAVRGKLVEQDPRDESASELIKRIQMEKERLAKADGFRQDSVSLIEPNEMPFELPPSWVWMRVGWGFEYDAGTKREPRELMPDKWLLELEDIEKDTSVVHTRLKVKDRDSRSTKSEFRAGDILYGKLRPYLNKVVFADEEGYSTTEIVAIRPFIPMSSSYCCLAFRRPDFVAYVSRVGQGTKMPRLRTQDALVALFPLPPIAEQHRIVGKVDELMALCDQLEKAQRGREARRDRLAAAANFHLNDSANAEEFYKQARFYLDHLPYLTSRSEQVKELRQTILNLAVHGRLAKQESGDEPASELLKRIQTEKARLTKEGVLRKEKPLPPVTEDDVPFSVPSSWRWERIGVVSLFTDYGTSVKSDHLQSGVPVLKMGDIQGGQVILGGQKKVPRKIDDLPQLFLKRFDLLYNRTNSAELVGKTGVYLGDDDAYTFASYLIRIRFLDNLTSPAYANLAMNAPYFRATQIIPELQQQCGQANVNGTKLRSMLIPVPPLAEQRRIVTKVDELMTVCDELEKKLSNTQTECHDLLEAVLHHALSDGRSTESAIAPIAAVLGAK